MKNQVRGVCEDIGCMVFMGITLTGIIEEFSRTLDKEVKLMNIARIMFYYILRNSENDNMVLKSTFFVISQYILSILINTTKLKIII